MPKHFRFEALVKAVLPDLYRYAFWLSRHPAQADDLVQETLFRAWKALDSLRDEYAARGWLIKILRREHARQFEKKRGEHVDIADLSGADEFELSQSDRPELDEIREAMFELEYEYREPLVLQVLMGYSTSEIAEVMDLSTGAVLTRLFRARKKLQARLGETGQTAEEVA